MVSEVPADTAALFQRYKKRKRREATAKILGAMFARFPLFDPDDFLNRIKPFSNQIFSRFGFMIWLVVVVWGVSAVTGSTDELVAQSYRVLDPSNLPWLFLVTAVMKAFHEYGHMALCKKYGGSVRRAGILLMIFTPMPFADTTSAWGFRDRWQRLLVGFGGMIVEVDRPELFEVGPAIDANGTLRYTLKSGVVGAVTLSVRAQDNGGTENGGVDTSAVQTALISIFSPSPPTIVIGPGIPDPYWLQVNTLLDLPVTWTVGPGRIGTVTVSSGPSWSSVSGDGNRLTGVPLRGHPGISEIWVTVTDDLGATVTTSITIQLFRPWDLSRKWLEVPLFEGATSDLLLEGDRIEIPITAGQWPIETVSNTTASDSSIRTFNVNQQPLREMASGYEAEIVYAGADGLFGTEDDIHVQVETSVVDDRRKRLTVVIPPKGPSGPARLEVKVAGRVVFSVSI